MIIVRQPIAGLSERALERFTARARRAAGLRAQVNVVLTTSGAVRALNRKFRGHDEPTDVLSFPALETAPDNCAGDIVISAGIAQRNARRLRHASAVEVKILILHGVLHLAGYDHERDQGGMARKEARLRRELRLPESLIERAQPGAAVPPRRGRTPGTGRGRSPVSSLQFPVSSLQFPVSSLQFPVSSFRFPAGRPAGAAAHQQNRRDKR